VIYGADGPWHRVYLPCVTVNWGRYYLLGD